ncbi:MAG: cupin domain-containing protein [Chloroflexota bacterium]|nr:cupin domain-containing protein [Chloroflexota bacterium]
MQATYPGAVWWQGALFSIKARRETTGGALGLVEASFWEGMATPFHTHHREDEAFYVLDGQIRFRRGDDHFTAGPGDFVFGPRAVPHCFKVLDGGARALVLVTPAGFEHMFLEGGIPVSDPAAAPAREYDLEHVARLAHAYGMEVVGPPLE